VEPPRHGEVTIRLAACGVCHSDLSATNGTIGYPLPLILGHEGAGVVADVGEGVRELKPGDPVITSFVRAADRNCACNLFRHSTRYRTEPCAPATVDVTTEDQLGKALYKLTGGGADYAFDCVGLGKVTEQAWNILKRGGRAVTVGITSAEGKIVLSSQRVPVSEKTLTGSYYGSARPQHDVPRLIGLYPAGRLKLDELITRRYSIDEAPRAFADLEQGEARRGVILL